MLIYGAKNWPQHKPWFAFTLLATAAAVAWYWAASVRAGVWLGGGSLPGLTFGVAGGLIIAFEMLLWVRKRYRAVRVGRATLWMKAHIWLGVLCLPLIVLHGGFRWWGGSLASVLMFLFLVVIVSGVWGLGLQQVLPRLMLENVPAETILAQIGDVLAQLLEEAGRVVRATCGVDEPPAAAGGGGGRDKAFIVVGAVRASGPVQGKLLRTRGPAGRVPGSEPLLAFFEEVAVPYLRSKTGSGSPLASARRAGVIFRAVRAQLDPAAHDALGVLEDACDQRRQFDLQARIDTWLRVWLCVHLPASAVVFVLMVVHIWYALKYY